VKNFITVSLAVALLFTGSSAFAADAPNIADSYKNRSIQDKTWCFGMFGEKTVSGSPANDTAVASEELYNHIGSIRKWTTTETTSLWFASWRISARVAIYNEAAQNLDSAFTDYPHADKRMRAYASRTAAAYRKISDLLAVADKMDQVKLNNELFEAVEETRRAELSANGLSTLQSQTDKDHLVALLKK